MSRRIVYAVLQRLLYIIVATFISSCFSVVLAHEIHEAARRGDLEKVRSLLEKDGSIVDLRDESNFMNTPLHLAAAAGSERVAALLLKAGAAVDSKAASGETPLYYAVRNARTATVDLLLRAGAERNVRAQDGFTPLHTAAAGDQPYIAMMLIEAGASVNEGARHGLTPLHLAAAFGFGQVAEVLVDSGADMNLRSSDNSTAIHLAAAGARDELVAYFMYKGMKLDGVQYPVHSGPFLGAEPPSTRPEAFLPGVVMNIYRPHGSVASPPGGREIYWARAAADPGKYEAIWYMKEEKGRWTPPQIAQFSVEYNCNYPAFSPDGRRLFFTSNRPSGPEKGRGALDIWFVDRTGAGWSEPVNMGALAGLENTDAEHASVSSDGTVYYHLVRRTGTGIEADIWSSSPTGAGYSNPRRLPAAINTESAEAGPCVAPDGSYLIFASNCGQGGDAGFAIMASFRDDDGGWRPAVSLSGILDPGMSRCAGISADGKYIFFIGATGDIRDYYWVDSAVMDSLRHR